ncbi:Unknown protein, partial [Striga hermonthica]
VSFRMFVNLGPFDLSLRAICYFFLLEDKQKAKCGGVVCYVFVLIFMCFFVCS